MRRFVVGLNLACIVFLLVSAVRMEAWRHWFLVLVFGIGVVVLARGTLDAWREVTATVAPRDVPPYVAGSSTGRPPRPPSPPLREPDGTFVVAIRDWLDRLEALGIEVETRSPDSERAIARAVRHELDLKAHRRRWTPSADPELFYVLACLVEGGHTSSILCLDTHVEQPPGHYAEIGRDLASLTGGRFAFDDAIEEPDAADPRYRVLRFRSDGETHAKDLSEGQRGTRTGPTGPGEPRKNVAIDVFADGKALDWSVLFALAERIRRQCPPWRLAALIDGQSYLVCLRDGDLDTLNAWMGDGRLAFVWLDADG